MQQNRQAEQVVTASAETVVFSHKSGPNLSITEGLRNYLTVVEKSELVEPGKRSVVAAQQHHKMQRSTKHSIFHAQSSRHEDAVGQTSTAIAMHNVQCAKQKL